MTVELSIVMPCLNEAETLEICIHKARAFLQRSGVSGEVVVADNGSTDGSQQIARHAGARIVDVAEKGYGNALMGGIAAARGEFVVMGDADDSYDFEHLDQFVKQLRDGADLVMGNRFAGGIEPGAMPPLHRYVGNPLLSWLGRLFFKVPVRDFHCGLRGFRRSSILALDLQTTGMEFASEIVVRSAMARFDIREVPTTLKKDGRTRPPHLRSFRDGWRHLRFLLLFCPRWLFLFPGLTLTIAGTGFGTVLLAGPVRLGSFAFDIGTLLYCAAAVLVGVQSIAFALLTKVYAIEEGFLPRDPRMDRLYRVFKLETGLLVGAVLLVLGVAASFVSFFRWRNAGFSGLDPAQQVRVVTPAVVGFALGCQVLLVSLFLSILGMRHNSRRHRADSAAARESDAVSLSGHGG